MYYSKEIQGPQIHALVVGVGSYPSGMNYGFGNLGSPPISAQAFADWLINCLNHPTAKLASVELLISPEQQNPRAPGQTHPHATFENFKAFANAWFDRCNSSRDNILIFYFCGHGIETGGRLSLLFEEFGSNQRNPFADAFDFDRNQLGLAVCNAQDQYYFVDACRNQPQALNQFEDYTSTVLFAPQFGKTHQGDAPIFLATGPDQRAYGYPDQPARFTNALLQAFGGMAATGDLSGREPTWVVNSNSLAQAVGFILDRENALPGIPRQEPDRGRGGKLLGKVFHKYDLTTNKPTALISIEVEPDNLSVTLNAPVASQIPPYCSPIPPDWPWQSFVRLLNRHDVYTVQATIGQNVVQVVPPQLVVIPPFTPARISRQP